VFHQSQPQYQLDKQRDDTNDFKVTKNCTNKRSKNDNPDGINELRVFLLHKCSTCKPKRWGQNYDLYDEVNQQRIQVNCHNISSIKQI
jgi:hypothetical protein